MNVERKAELFDKVIQILSRDDWGKLRKILKHAEAYPDEIDEIAETLFEIDADLELDEEEYEFLENGEDIRVSREALDEYHPEFDINQKRNEDIRINFDDEDVWIFKFDHMDADWIYLKSVGQAPYGKGTENFDWDED